MFQRTRPRPHRHRHRRRRTRTSGRLPLDAHQRPSETCGLGADCFVSPMLANTLPVRIYLALVLAFDALSPFIPRCGVIFGSSPLAATVVPPMITEPNGGRSPVRASPIGGLNGRTEAGKLACRAHRAESAGKLATSWARGPTFVSPLLIQCARLLAHKWTETGTPTRRDLQALRLAGLIQLLYRKLWALSKATCNCWPHEAKLRQTNEAALSPGRNRQTKLGHRCNGGGPCCVRTRATRCKALGARSKRL